METSREPAILYLDDDRPNLDVFRRGFDDHFRVIAVASPREALRIISNDEVGVVVSDQRMPEMSGIEFLVAAADRNPHATRMLLTTYSDHELLLDAINRGHVHDYVLKVWDMKDMAMRLRNGLEAYLRRIAAARAENEAELLREELAAREGADRIIGLERGLHDVAAVIPRLVARDQAVLLCGERGTGRRTLAREIHRRTRHSHGPFVRFACAAHYGRAPADVLFGSTDSRQPLIGRIERAQGGVLYLEQLEALPPELQNRLEAVLQSRSLDARSGRRVAALDLRLMASTTVDLAAAAARGDFNPALYQRFTGGTLAVPALRERVEDIAPLAQAIIEHFGREHGSQLRLTSAALDALAAYSWPGNVQELVLLLARVALCANSVSEIDAGMLGLDTERIQ